MKPEDREMPIGNPAQQIPPFVGGGLASQEVAQQSQDGMEQVAEQGSKSEVLQFGEKKGRGLKDRTKDPQVDERPVAPAKPSQLTPSMLRDCALPEYNGDSDEFILGGKVTAIEALQLYRDHFAKIAKEQGLVTVQEVDEVSPAEIIGAGGKKLIWLPVLYSRGQMIQVQKGTIAKQVKEIAQLTSDRDYYRQKVADQARLLERKDEQIDTIKLRSQERIQELEIAIDEARRPWWKRIWG